MREYSVPQLVDIAESANLTGTVFARAEQEPNAVALRRKVGSAWRDVTTREFRDDIVATAKGLIAAGIEPGDRVAVLSRTRYEWTVIDYAILTAGAVTVPIYETSSAEQVKWIVGDSGAKAIFVEQEGHLATVERVKGDLPDLASVWVLDKGALDELAEAGKDVDDATVTERRTSRKAADLATIVYTSGTTGMPKGCRLTHENLLFDVQNAVQGALSDLFNVGDRCTLLFLPLAHVFARVIQIGCIESSTILGHTPDLANVAPELESFKPTFLLAVPRVFEKVYNRAEQKAAEGGKQKIFHAAAATAIAYSRALDSGGAGLGLKLKHALFDRLVYGKLRAATGGRLTHAVAGGSALGERLGHFFRGIGIEIFEGWGMTETSAAATVNTPQKNKVGSVGRPFPGCSIAIADDGEVLVKGRHIFGGYWNNEKATADTVDADGWLHTGDIGELDDDGFLRITGRKKELIVTAAGKNVAPAPLEDSIRAHPLISQCIVVGDDRPFIAALVTLDPEALDQWKAANNKSGDAGILRDDPEIKAEVDKAVEEANESVSKAESIRKYAILEVDLTEDGGYLTPTLKIKRNIVQRDFAKQIDELYTK